LLTLKVDFGTAKVMEKVETKTICLELDKNASGSPDSNKN
jgi:hypothetical protein